MLLPCHGGDWLKHTSLSLPQDEHACKLARVLVAALPCRSCGGCNALSFGIADMGSAIPNIAKLCRTVPTITKLVTAIATYHYVQIFSSWVEDFEVKNSQGGDYILTLSGAPFIDAYHYVDWLLTLPLLLIELVLVIKMTKKDTVVLSWSLGLVAAAMVGMGYHGEIQDDLHVRWFWWKLAMVPFVLVVAVVLVGLMKATCVKDAQEEFNNMLNEDEMKDAVAATFVGKRDLPNAMPTADVTSLYYGCD